MTYLDHAATTPLRPEARESMLAWMDRTGNPSGAHRAARDARRALDDARDVFAAMTGFSPGDVVFCSGGTEADNLAVTGTLAAAAASDDGSDGHVAVTTAIEHPGVLSPVEAAGGRVVGVDARGVVDQEKLAAALDDAVAIVSIMVANNEVGVVQPMDELCALVREQAPQAAIHTDAVQGAMWLDLADLDVDLLSVSAHKFGGPQGVGVLVVRPDVALAPLLLGGGQERGRRSGTQNVAGVVGAAAAARATLDQRAELNPVLAARRDRLVEGLVASVEGAVETGDRSTKVPGSAHLCFPGVESEALLFLLEDLDVYASAASSCASGAAEPSHVLSAMGVPREMAAGSLRLSLGWSTTEADVDHALSAVPAAVERLRRFRR